LVSHCLNYNIPRHRLHPALPLIGHECSYALADLSRISTQVCRSAKVPIGTSWLKLHFSSELRTHRPLTVLQTNTIHRPKRNSDRHSILRCCAFRARFVIQFTDQTMQPAHEQHSIGIVLLIRDYTPLNGKTATVWSSQLGPPVQTLRHSIGAD